METININNYNSEQYTSKLNELYGGIYILLDEFKKNYVITKMHPLNEEYKQRYENNLSKFTEIQSKLFSISNDVQVNIEDLNNQLFKINILIKKEKETNKQLKLKLGIVETKNNAANELIDDYTTIYDIKYLQNWAIVLSIIGCLISIKMTYNPQIVV